MKSYALAAVLSSVMVAGSALADNDFRALGKVSSLAPMTEGQLASVEGGFADNILNLNAAIPTITAVNAAVLLGNARSHIDQDTNQSIVNQARNIRVRQ
ncbi:hypothetical protein ACWJKU_16850 [Methylocaldum sp. MU1018]